MTPEEAFRLQRHPRRCPFCDQSMLVAHQKVITLLNPKSPPAERLEGRFLDWRCPGCGFEEMGEPITAGG